MDTVHLLLIKFCPFSLFAFSAFLPLKHEQMYLTYQRKPEHYRHHFRHSWHALFEGAQNNAPGALI